MKLIVEHSGQRTERRLGPGHLGLGRAPENELCVPDPRISRQHCRLEPAENGCWVVDLGSANGVLLNGERTDRGFLRPGDELLVGGARLTLEVEEEFDTLAGSGTLLDPGEVEPGPWTETRQALAALQQPELLRAVAGFLDAAIAGLAAERGFLLVESAEIPGLPAGGEARRCLAARQFDQSDIPLPEARLSLAVAESLFGQGRPVLSLDAGNDARFRASASVQELKLRALIAAPVRAGGRVVAALLLDNRLQKAAFDGEALARLSLLADLLGLDLERRRAEAALAEERRRNEELQAGREVLPPVAWPETARRSGRDYAPLVGRSAAMRQVFEQLDRIVDHELPVLIQGESGTGKELVARAIHRHGSRSRGPFISENCAALPDSLLESELFGHARGAFTGADRAKKGLIAQAHGGTLFLDEIGDMSTEMQKKLLRVLQEGELRPVGSDQVERVDVRLVTASHKDLERLVASGDFRQDLFYRINVLSLRLPPLRERRDDVPLLCRSLQKRIASEIGRTPPRLPHEVLVALSEYTWPGNVRELENELRRLMVVAEEQVRLLDLSPRILERAERAQVENQAFGEIQGDLRTRVADFEHRSILAALERQGGNKSRAAAELGLSRFALQRKLDKYNGVETSASNEDRPEGPAAE
jgi:transcriptional regulator with GAF, ATPase, and Fis domain